jgi:hypothetical protein
MVVGKDLKVDQILEFAGKALIGKSMGKQISKESLNAWMQNVCVPLIGYGPSFHILTRGWIRFSFPYRGDSTSILCGS